VAAGGAALGVIPVGARAERLLSLPGWQVRIAAPEPVAAPLAATLSAIAVAEPLPPLEVSVSEDGRQAAGTAEGRLLWSVALPRSGWLPLLVGQVGATATALLRRLLFIHAGAVAVEGRAWVIIGESGTGKTSTVALLTRHGAAYLTDEITLLDPAAGTALPFPLPMAVKPWTAEAVGPLPEGSEVANEGSVRFYLPADRGAGPTSIRAFVLLRPGGRPELRPLSRAEVLMALGQHHSSLRYPHRLEDAFAGFSRLLRGARCYSLTAPSPAAAAELLTAAARAS